MFGVRGVSRESAFVRPGGGRFSGGLGWVVGGALVWQWAWDAWAGWCQKSALYDPVEADCAVGWGGLVESAEVRGVLLRLARAASLEADFSRLPSCMDVPSCRRSAGCGECRQQHRRPAAFRTLCLCGRSPGCRWVYGSCWLGGIGSLAGQCCNAHQFSLCHMNGASPCSPCAGLQQPRFPCPAWSAGGPC